MGSRSIQLSVGADNQNPYGEEEDEDEVTAWQRESSINWRNIIFLPFSHVWQLFVIITILINTFVTIFDTAYQDDEDKETTIDMIHYAMEVVFLFDVVLAVMHRNLANYRVIREYTPRPLLQIFFDGLTLLPIYEVYLLLQYAAIDRPDGYNSLRDIVRIKSVLRLYRVYLYLSNLTYQAGFNQVVNVAVTQAIKIAVLSHLMAAIWYTAGCYKCGWKNWTDDVEDLFFDRDDPWHWLLVCFITLGSWIEHTWKGTIRGYTILERVFMIVIILFGYIEHIMLFFGSLNAVYVKRFRKQHEFERRMHHINGLLDRWCVEKELKERTLQYYDTLWNRREGITEMPSIFNQLTVPMQKEVTVDIFWEALRHSQMFSKEEMPFKRAVSREMKSEFFLPGDYLYKIGELKCKMIYIITGIIQILSEEDEESPIMSFSNGTVLGETSVILPTNANANVRCAAYCEVHSLSLAGLARVLRLFPERGKAMREYLKEKLNVAKEMVEIKKEKSDYESRNAYYNLIAREDSTIRWLKNRWRQLRNLHKTRKMLSDNEVLVRQVDRLHTSRNLNMLVLSEDVELKIDAICLKERCPFVMEPTSSFRVYLDNVILIAVIVHSTILPYAIFFQREIAPFLYPILFVLDLIYFIDIYVQLSTAVKKANLHITVPSQIIIHKLKDMFFLIDICSSMPIDYVAIVIGSSKHAAALCKLNRLLKIYKLFVRIWNKEQELMVNPMRIRILKYFCLYIILVYWGTCAMYGISCFYVVCQEYGWFNYNVVMSQNSGAYEEASLYPFIRTLAYVTITCLNLGLSRTFQYTTTDMVAHFCLVTCAYFLFTFTFSEICATFISKEQEKAKYMEFIAAMNYYMQRNKVDIRLRKRVASIMQFKWVFNKNIVVTGKDGVLEDAPEYLKEKLIRSRIRNCLRATPFFKDCKEEFVQNVALRAVVRTLPPGALITSVNHKCRWMHVILRGYCTQRSIMAGDRERDRATTLQAGDSFPVIELAHQVLVLVEVVSLTSVELVSIKYLDLVDILHGDAELRKSYNECLDKHMETYEAQLLRKGGRLPPMEPPVKSLGQGELFEYVLYDNEDVNVKRQEYMTPFRALGKLSFLRYLFLRRTIRPLGKFFIFWEITRYINAVVRVVKAIGHQNFLMPFNTTMGIMNLVMDIITFADFYVRMHCQYYNEKGILVTHPLYTTYHYLTTQFILDVWCISPMVKFELQEDMNNHEYVYVSNIIFLLMTHPVHLYRVICAMNYIKSNLLCRYQITIMVIQYLLVALTVMGSFATILQLITCPIYKSAEGEIIVECTGHSWMTHSRFADVRGPGYVFVACLYFVSTFFTMVATGAFTLVTEKEILLLLPIIAFTYALRVYVLAKITSSLIGGNVKLTLYQEQVKSFEKFVKHEYVDEDLVEATIEHYQYVWKKTQGFNVSQTLTSYLDPNLHEDITFDMYASTLQAADFFADADESFFRLIGVHMKEMYFKKDAIIVRCNDIQDTLYFVHRGKVDVMMAKTKLTTMGKGGIFGCLARQGKTRQTITILARVHVAVLAIETVMFHKVIAEYSTIKLNVQHANFINAEYLESKKYAVQLDEDESLRTFSSKMSSSKSSSGRIMAEKAFNTMRVLIDENGRFFRIWNYITSVHLASISSLLYSFLIIILDWQESMSVTASWLLSGISWFIDFIFSINIYIGFHLAYRDPESGLKITNFGMIGRRYFCSLKRFWLDLLTCIPVDAFMLIFLDDDNLLRYGYVNRLFRFLYLTKYYFYQQYNLNLRAHLRWTYLIYWVLYTVQIMACMWWMAACYQHPCKRADKIGHANKTYIKEPTQIGAVLLAYTQAVNIFASAELHETSPITWTQMTTLFAMMIIGVITFVVLASGFATLLAISNYTMANFEYRLEDLRVYLQGRELSPFIFNNVWKYFLQLWHRQRGEWMPSLITEAPAYLRQDLMGSLYGHYIESHILFQKTHVDFIRQLVVHLKRCVFFPGNFLVEKGDMDGSMYFIHDGLVQVFDKHGNNEMLRETLGKGKSFGEAQGLLNTPHEFSYRAYTVVDAVILKLEDWEYLLHWFPASKEEIFNKAAQTDLRRKAVIF